MLNSFKNEINSNGRVAFFTANTHKMFGWNQQVKTQNDDDGEKKAN